jgi:hypothetical protein
VHPLARYYIRALVQCRDIDWNGVLRKAVSVYAEFYCDGKLLSGSIMQMESRTVQKDRQQGLMAKNDFIFVMPW